MNRKKLLTSILISIFLSVSLVSITRAENADRAEKADLAGSSATPQADGPHQYWKNSTGLIVGISDLGCLDELEMPVGYQHIVSEGWGVCYDIGGVTQPSIYERDNDCSENQVGPGTCDIYQQSFISNKGPGGSSTATAVLISGTLKVKVVTKDILNNFKFVNSLFWKTSRSRVDMKTTITNISGSPMTNVLYRRVADIDTDGPSSNNWSERSRSVSASNDKSVAPPGGETHTVIMSGDPKPDSAEVAEDCCSPNDLTSCSGYLADNPVTPLLGLDRSGVIEWNLGNMANMAVRTRTTTYTVDEDMRK